jgi:hypothetical protein
MAPTPASSTFFTPPALPAKYNVQHMNITQAHQISARTKAVLSALRTSTGAASGEKQTSASDEALRTNGGEDGDEKKGDAKDQITIMALTAPNPKAAGKLISVVEIVKRELQRRTKGSEGGTGSNAKGKGWWQYTQLKSVVREVPREVKRAAKKGGEEGTVGNGGKNAEEDNDDEEDAFEPVPKPAAKRKRDGEAAETNAESNGGDSTMKKRAMPILTVYLSTAPVKELKMAFG